jgi:hypothetical protein
MATQDLQLSQGTLQSEFRIGSNIIRNIVLIFLSVTQIRALGFTYEGRVHDPGTRHGNIEIPGIVRVRINELPWMVAVIIRTKRNASQTMECS